jgi:hypothetical protein
MCRIGKYMLLLARRVLVPPLRVLSLLLSGMCVQVRPAGSARRQCRRRLSSEKKQGKTEWKRWGHRAGERTGEGVGGEGGSTLNAGLS